MKTHYKYIFLILIVSFSCVNRTRDKKLNYPSKLDFKDSICYSMTCLAIDDINSGKYKLYEFGIVPSADTNTSILLKRYNIELVYEGCNVELGIDCYRAIMDSVIKAKFPHDIITQPIDRFDRMHLKDEFFTLMDSSINNKIIKTVTQLLNSLNGLSTGRACMQIMIDRNGKPINIKWLKGLDSTNDSILIARLMKEKFDPMMIGEDKVNSIVTNQLE